MCGRFTLTVSPEELQAAFPSFDIPPDIPASFNIAPSQPISVVPNDKNKKMTFMRWGLVPSWAKDENFGGYNLINARSETAAEKPSFKNSFRRRRCAVLTDGFLEWKKNSSGTKTPYYITMKSREPFAFAGLWEEWISPVGDLLLSACILTTTPNQVVQPIHNRMPVILNQANLDKWLQPGEVDPVAVQPILKPFSGKDLEAYPVTTYVNSPGNNSPKCIQPAGMF
jgi:putative SOS response-associated peptidase YedK